jgi:hypothetical protein
MKRVMLIALMAIFSTVMFAQTKSETKPATEKKKTHGTEVKAPANEVKPAAQPAGKEEAKPTAVKKEEGKPATGKKEEAKPAGKKAEQKSAGNKESAKPTEPKVEATPKK